MPKRKTNPKKTGTKKRNSLKKRIDYESRGFSKAFGKAGRDIERHGDMIDIYWKRWWFDAMGVMGPLIKSVLGIALFAVGLVILSFINSFVASGFLTLIYGFFFYNIQWFFLASLFFSYAKYLSIRRPWRWWMFSPVVSALNVAFAVWVLASVLSLIGSYIESDSIVAFSGYVIVSVPAMAVIVAVILYALEFSKKALTHVRR